MQPYDLIFGQSASTKSKTLIAQGTYIQVIDPVADVAGVVPRLQVRTDSGQTFELRGTASMRITRAAKAWHITNVCPASVTCTIMIGDGEYRDNMVSQTVSFEDPAIPSVDSGIHYWATMTITPAVANRFGIGIHVPFDPPGTRTRVYVDEWYITPNATGTSGALQLMYGAHDQITPTADLAWLRYGHHASGGSLVEWIGATGPGAFRVGAYAAAAVPVAYGVMYTRALFPSIPTAAVIGGNDPGMEFISPKFPLVIDPGYCVYVASVGGSSAAVMFECRIKCRVKTFYASKV